MQSSSNEELFALGWTDERQSEIEELHPRAEPARVVVQHRSAYEVATTDGTATARVTGRFRGSSDSAGLPVVGDWVALVDRHDGSATIEGVLPRRTQISRKVAGLVTQEQVLVANVDVIFITNGLNEDFNVRRIERYLTLAWESGALPVIVLNKADLCDDIESTLKQTSVAAPGVDILVASATTSLGLEELRGFATGKTVVFVGSSGVGKSSLINLLLDSDAMRVEAIRSDGKGRHTTTNRRLLPLAGGGALIDTPGMRELQLWDAPEGLERSFSDIVELAGGCRFSDCRHEHEPDCAVREAVASGELDFQRLVNYRKQEKEIASLALRKDAHLRREEARKFKLRSRDARARSRAKHR